MESAIDHASSAAVPEGVSGRTEPVGIVSVETVSGATLSGRVVEWVDRRGADLRVVLPPYLIARVLVGLSYGLAQAIAERWYGGPPSPLTEGLLAWDGNFYRDIGVVGYEQLPLDSLRFFPLYPLVARGVSLAFDGNQGFALVVVANVAALVLGMLIRRLVLAYGGSVEQADRSVWAVMLFPSAFVLVWAYSEALFLIFAVGSLLAARRDRWLIAGALAAFAALTRPLGVLLVLPLAIEAVERWRAATDEPPAWSVIGARLLAVVAPLGGTMAFVLWVERAWGVLFLPFTVQSDLRGETVNPVARLLRGGSDLVGVERFGDGLHLPFAVVFVALVVVAWRRLPKSAAAYATVVLLAALSAANLNSLERYALNGFPLAIALAFWANTVRRERLALSVCASGLLALSALAWLGLYVP